MASSPPSTAVNVRLPFELAQKMQRLTNLYGITITEAVRMLLQRALSNDEMFSEHDIKVTPTFIQDRERSRDEYVGRLDIEVSVPESLQAELGRIIFVLPEFTSPEGFEPYRVDNAHYVRVDFKRVVVLRKADSRAVSSFRLINGKWVGSIYRYSQDITHEQMLKEIEEAMVKTITQTLRLKLVGLLPPEREMTEAEYAEYEARNSSITFY